MAPIASVYLSADVFMVCLNHALVTEKEEVMGLLIGEIDERRISNISAVITLRRSDKRKDRVEISPEQLLAQKLNRPMRVIGWYHSHPHITVWPSHVDVRTQAMYQMMDDGFVGIIISVFNSDKATNQGRIELTCFQSETHSQQVKSLEIPVHVLPTTCISKTCLDVMSQLPSILCEEEEAAYESTMQAGSSILKDVYNEAVLTKALCDISEVASMPLVQMMENRLEQNKKRFQQLCQEKQKLLRLLKS
uniref:MPN domain-containing protein n=1 Tax=Strigamia maritima TaxID=126957 RepID=T1IX35_STRMM